MDVSFELSPHKGWLRINPTESQRYSDIAVMEVVVMVAVSRMVDGAAIAEKEQQGFPKRFLFAHWES